MNKLTAFCLDVYLDKYAGLRFSMTPFGCIYRTTGSLNTARLKMTSSVRTTSPRATENAKMVKFLNKRLCQYIYGEYCDAAACGWYREWNGCNSQSNGAEIRVDFVRQCARGVEERSEGGVTADHVCQAGAL